MTYKIGRNDPCPCGSGKKYKRCCGVISENQPLSTNPFERHNQYLTTLKLKLDQHFHAQIKQVRHAAVDQFLRFTVNHTLPPEHEALFSDWLWWDWRNYQGKTMAEIYLTENGSYMVEPLRETMQQMITSHLSVFQVIGNQDTYLDLWDIFKKESFQVLLKAPWEIHTDFPILLLGRLAQIPEGHIFSGMIIYTEDNLNQEKFIKKHLEYVLSVNDLPLADLLKNRSELLYGLFDHAHKKVFFNLRDIQMAAISTSQTDLIQTHLKQSPDYTLVHQTGEWFWFKPQKGTLGYVRIAITPGFIFTAADILEDVKKLKETILEVIPDCQFQILSSTVVNSPPPVEYNHLWFTILKDQQTEIWLETPHPELEGKTPSEIIKDQPGRQHLLEMLFSFRNQVETEEEYELIDYMYGRIQSTLID
ncbi:SEC-C metal-binding domain-containing protein [Syntrophomonas erecta]